MCIRDRGYTVFGNVYINNGSDAALDASMLAGDYAAKLGAQGPQVLIIHTPVSYTHLDVYKRQAPRAPRPWRG